MRTFHEAWGTDDPHRPIDPKLRAALERQVALLRDNDRLVARLARAEDELERLKKAPPDLAFYVAEAREEGKRSRDEEVANAKTLQARAERGFKTEYERTKAWKSEVRKVHGILNHTRHLLKNNASTLATVAWIKHGLDKAMRRYKELRRTLG